MLCVAAAAVAVCLTGCGDGIEQERSTAPSASAATTEAESAGAGTAPAATTEAASTGAGPRDGDCRVGLHLAVGDGCTYPGSSQRFIVNADGSGSLGFATSGRAMQLINADVGGEQITFEATRQADDIWLVETVGHPDDASAAGVETSSASGECAVGMSLNPGDACTYEGFSIMIRDDGAAVLDGSIGGIHMGGTVINGQSINLNRFSASKDGSAWTIESLP